MDFVVFPLQFVAFYKLIDLRFKAEHWNTEKVDLEKPFSPHNNEIGFILHLCFLYWFT